MHHCTIFRLSERLICPLCWIEWAFGKKPAVDLITDENGAAIEILFKKQGYFTLPFIQARSLAYDSCQKLLDSKNADQLLNLINKAVITELQYLDVFGNPDFSDLPPTIIRVVFHLAKVGDFFVEMFVDPTEILIMAFNDFIAL
jgi:hypothetical protein